MEKDESARRQADAVSSTADFLAAFNAEVREQLAEVERKQRRKRKAARLKREPLEPPAFKVEQPEPVTERLKAESATPLPRPEATPELVDLTEEPAEVAHLTLSRSVVPGREPLAPPRPAPAPAEASAPAETSTPGLEPSQAASAVFKTAHDFTCSLPEAVASSSAQQAPIPFPQSPLEAATPPHHWVPNAPEMPRLSPPPARPRYPPAEPLSNLPAELVIHQDQGSQSSQARRQADLKRSVQPNSEHRPHVPVKRRPSAEDEDQYAGMPASPWVAQGDRKPSEAFDLKLKAKIERVKKDEALKRLPQLSQQPWEVLEGQPTGTVYHGQPESCGQASTPRPAQPPPYRPPVAALSQLLQRRAQSSQLQHPGGRIPPPNVTLTQSLRGTIPEDLAQWQSSAPQSSSRPGHHASHLPVQTQDLAQPPPYHAPRQPQMPQPPRQSQSHQAAPRRQRSRPDEMEHEAYVRDYATAMLRFAKVTWLMCGCEKWAVRLEDAAATAWVNTRHTDGHLDTQRWPYDPSNSESLVRLVAILVLDHAECHTGPVVCRHCRSGVTKNLRQHRHHLREEHGKALTREDASYFRYYISATMLVLRDCFPTPA